MGAPGRRHLDASVDIYETDDALVLGWSCRGLHRRNQRRAPRAYPQPEWERTREPAVKEDSISGKKAAMALSSAPSDCLPS
jgi:hypothetical protein